MPRFDAREFDDRESQDTFRPGGGGRSGRAAVPEDTLPSGPPSQGTVKKMHYDKGFGFIRAENGEEYFFHRSHAQGYFDALQEGEAVTFQPMKSPKGLRAHEVSRA